MGNGDVSGKPAYFRCHFSCPACFPVDGFNSRDILVKVPCFVLTCPSTSNPNLPESPFFFTKRTGVVIICSSLGRNLHVVGDTWSFEKDLR